MIVKKRMFISFDYENDGEWRHALTGKAKLSNSPFEIADCSERAQSKWKKVHHHICKTSLVTVICGERTNVAWGVAAKPSITCKGSKYYLPRVVPTRPAKNPHGRKIGQNLRMELG